MGMSIDNANKLLSVITATITEDDDCFTIEDENLQVFKEALLIAIETMRKYQKIKNIICKWEDGLFDDEGVLDVEVLEMISDEVEDGNGD